MNSFYARRVFSLTFVTVLSGFLFGQTIEQKTEITKEYNQDKLSKLESEFKGKSEKAKKRALELAEIKGWPLTYTTAEGSFAELQDVDDSGNPLYYVTSNVDAAESTRTDHLNSGGSLGLNLNGDNMTAGVWDGGIARASHQEYDGAGGTNRFSVGDGSSSLNFHAAHVTGTIMASGVQANAKGMAPYCNVLGSDWNSDLSEATSAAASGMLVSNHSYGYGIRDQFGNVQLPQYFFGGYISVSRDWDQIMYNAPNYLMVVAAGNDGNDNSANTDPIGGNGSYDKLNGTSTCKNNLVVANAQDANIDASGNLISVSINSSSSEGPTDDLRIKPDITGNGTGVYSTYENSNSAYASISGTSMASPNVTGSLLLLQEHYNNVNGSYMRSATLKGLAMHTADDAGATGPDAVFGWGLMNSKRAAETITNNGSQTMIQELSLSSGQSYTITVDADGVNDLLASISWTDLPGTANTGVINPSTIYLVNDLDIRVTKSGTTYTPWKLTGPTSNTKADNNVDPFERVDVANASGTYTITVTHKGSLSSGSQNFSLIVTGITSGSGPEPVACTSTISNFPYSEGFENTLGAWTQGSGDDFDWTLLSGATPSSNTGPTAANEGSHYVYMESSTPNFATKNALLNSPCFDLTGLNNPTLSFDYHMYGAAEMGGLNLQVSVDGGAWSTIWSKSGDQGNNWLSESLSLNAYASSSEVKFRFNGTTGTTWQGDMAVDAFGIAGETVGEPGPSCSATITSFPYSQSYENTLGNWTQNSDDDFDWTVQSGATPSGNTGPSSANAGSYYAYMESSTPNYSTKNAKLTSPCFDLTGVSNPEISFDYHMYGAAGMGELNLEVSTNGTAWTTVWNRSGDQGNAWVSESIDLSAYSSSSAVRFRFNGTTGTTWQGDMAIDAVSVQGAAPSCTNVSLSITFDDYPEETSWEITNGSGVVASGGTYASQADGSTLNLDVCLLDGCYTFTINDVYGDGMCCAYGNGSYNLTNDANGAVLAQGGSFASNESTNFCIGGATNSQLSDVTPVGSEGSHFEVYPNPVSDLLYVEINSNRQQSYQVLDLNGKLLFEGVLENSMIDFSALATGVYIMKITDGTKTITEKVIKK
ncbi:MAG: S8 family serine peptidase [Crocinitomicaceae bacterium]